MTNKKNKFSKSWPIKAYKNQEFLSSGDARSVRVLCELLEPARRFKQQEVKNTIVFFGSARIIPPRDAKKNLDEIKKKLLSTSKTTPKIRRELEQAKQKAEIAYNLSHYYDDAVKLSRFLSEWSKSIENKDNRFFICSGGGPGIMEAANKGAELAGTKSIGLNISLPYEQLPNPYITPELCFEFHYFFIRKFWFLYLAKAVVIFPGGFGTMDELFEVLTLLQSGKILKKMPVVLYGKEYWDKLIDFNIMVEYGVISKSDLNLFKFIDTPEEAFEYLKKQLTKYYLKS